MNLLKKITLLFALAFIGINLSFAQTTRKDRQAAKIAEIKAIVDSQRYVFKANYVMPSRGAGRSLTSDYDLAVLKDSVIAYLPFFGRAYVAPISNPQEGGIKFTSTKFTYNAKTTKKGGWNISIKFNDKNISDARDVQSMNLSISNDGYASLQVINSNRDPISFNGYIEARKK